MSRLMLALVAATAAGLGLAALGHYAVGSRGLSWAGFVVAAVSSVLLFTLVLTRHKPCNKSL
jgi:hypothetical protein